MNSGQRCGMEKLMVLVPTGTAVAVRSRSLKNNLCTVQISYGIDRSR